MLFTDTHTHLYEEAFDADRTEMIQRAIDNGITKMFIPNVNSTTVDSMLSLVKQFPEHIFPMIGLHPRYEKPETYKSELGAIKNYLFSPMEFGSFIGIGEIGIDLYWDKTTLSIQNEAFQTQCDWAIEKDLPVAIHSRGSTQILIDILKSRHKNPRGVFHCFTGSLEEANEILELGFYLGIGGVVTYKNTNLRDTLKSIPIDRIVLETDSPYLPPVPHRGKRNESAYTTLVAQTLSVVYDKNVEDIAQITTRNARDLFGQ